MRPINVNKVANYASETWELKEKLYKNYYDLKEGF
jgi:hypothetical protein